MYISAYYAEIFIDKKKQNNSPLLNKLGWEI